MQKQILSKFINFKIFLFVISVFSCSHIKTIDREIENAIENSDPEEMRRLVAGNFAVSQEEKAYYLKLAKAKSEKAMAKVYRSLPKFSRTILGSIPAVLGAVLMIFSGYKLFEHRGYPIKTYDPTENPGAEDMKLEKNLARAGFLIGSILVGFGSNVIYKGIIENNEVVARDNALAVETIIARLNLL